MRISRGRGAGSDVLNKQAALVESSIRAAQDNARAYVDGLHRADADLKRLVDAYVRAARLSQSDADALLERCQRERHYTILLRRAVEAHAALDEARGQVERQREGYGPAIAAARVARQAVEQHEHAPQPPRWQPKSRRQWAELRRAERAVLADAEARERRAARPDLSALKTAEAQCEALEARRRFELPLASDAVAPADAAALNPPTWPTADERHQLRLEPSVPGRKSPRI